GNFAGGAGRAKPTESGPRNRGPAGRSAPAGRSGPRRAVTPSIFAYQRPPPADPGSQHPPAGAQVPDGTPLALKRQQAGPRSGHADRNPGVTQVPEQGR